MNFRMGKGVRRRIKEASAQMTYKDHFDHEITDLLTSYYFLIRQLPDSNDPLSNMETMWFIHILHSDIILRLIKFRDEDTRSWSFDQAFKKLRKRSKTYISPNDLSNLSKKISRYRKSTKIINDHRISYIAHREKRDRAHLRPADLLSLIRMAVEIVDDFSESRSSYHLLGIDLRVEVLGEEVADQTEERSA